MNRPADKTSYHPLHQPVSNFWWLQSGSYFAFFLREASCMFVAWFVVYLLLMVQAISQGDASYQEFLTWSARGWVVLLNMVSFLFLVYHAITFFDAAPQALVVHVGRKRVPGQLIGVSHYLGWLAVSVVLYLIIRGT